MPPAKSGSAADMNFFAIFVVVACERLNLGPPRNGFCCGRLLE